MSEANKSCPHCGGKVRLTEKRRGNYRREGSYFQGLCGKCFARGPLVQDSPDKALAAWNTRAPATPQWIRVDDDLPPDETAVLIILRGEIAIGELRWERPSYEEAYQPFRYWDNPHDDGKDWQWPDVTHWMPLPAAPKESA